MNLQEFSEHIGKPESEILEVIGFKSNYTARDAASMSRKDRKTAAKSQQPGGDKTSDQADDTSLIRHGVASSIGVTGFADGAQDAVEYMKGYTQGLKEVYSIFRTGQFSNNPVVAEGQARLLGQMGKLNDMFVTKKPLFFSDSSDGLLMAVEDYEMPDEEERKSLMSVLHSFRRTSLAIQGADKSTSLPSSLPAQTTELGTEPTWDQDTANYQG